MENFDLRKYLAEGKLLKEEVDVNKILSDGGYDEVDDEELLATVKSRLKGKSNIGAKALNLLIMKIEDEEGGEIDFSEGKQLNENAPGYDTRKFGESLPTMESVKAAYEAKKEDITETRDLSVKEKMDNILYVMDPVQVIDELIIAMSTDDANLYLDAIIQDHEIMMVDEA